MSINLYILAAAVAAGLLGALIAPPVVGPGAVGALVGVAVWFAGMWGKRFVE